VQAISDPGRSNAEALIMGWIDTREARAVESKAYAFLNDQIKTIPANVIDALNNYNVTPIAWSRKEEIIEELAA